MRFYSPAILLTEPNKYELIGSTLDEKEDNILADCADNQESLQRMQALLSELMRMENIVVLTDAGCSIHCCGKTMDFLEQFVLKVVIGIVSFSELILFMNVFQLITIMKKYCLRDDFLILLILYIYF